MTRPQVPNHALRGLLAEAGWTEEFLARQVNAVAAESGLVMGLDRRSVTHWLAGRRPRSPLPELVAEALSRRLRRPLGPSDIGLDDSLASTGRQPHTVGETPLVEDVATMLTRVAQFDGSRRQMLSGGTYSLASLAIPGWVQAVSRHPGLRLVPGASRIDAGRVAAAEQMTRVFSDMDTTFGGGRARAALSAYLAHDIAPELKATGTPALRRRLLSAATQLTYLAAFMCFDDECHGLAQRYYRIALELAAENNDPAAYAITMRGLSVQARSLGHREHAVQLAETAAETARNIIGSGRQAFFLGQVAVASAAAGNRHNALTALTAAERRLDRAASQATTVTQGSLAMGSYHPAALAHQQAAVRALLGDQKGAIAALSESIRYRPPHERRSRAIIHARLAEFHLDQGHLDQAVMAWHAFLDDYPYLTSGRATRARSILGSRLRPHRANPAVRQLLARLTA